MNLTEEEKKLLGQYQSLSISMPKLGSRLAVEIVPPTAFVIIGLVSGQKIWFIVLIFLMVFYNTQRVLRQYKNIDKLRSISEKTIGNVDGPKNT